MEIKKDDIIQQQIDTKDESYTDKINKLLEINPYAINLFDENEMIEKISNKSDYFKYLNKKK